MSPQQSSVILRSRIKELDAVGEAENMEPAETDANPGVEVKFGAFEYDFDTNRVEIHE